MIAIRTARSPDYPAIHDMIVRIFQATYGDGEQVSLLVENLRKLPAYDSNLSLVATDGDRVVGHVLFSRIEIVGDQERTPALALAPLCVDEAYRKQGIGARLVRLGMERGGRSDYAAVIVQGDPKYYGRFGFIPCAQRGLITPFPNPSSPANMVVGLHDQRFARLKGDVDYPSPFDVWKIPTDKKRGRNELKTN